MSRKVCKNEIILAFEFIDSHQFNEGCVFTINFGQHPSQKDQV